MRGSAVAMLPHTIQCPLFSLAWKKKITYYLFYLSHNRDVEGAGRDARACTPEGPRPSKAERVGIYFNTRRGSRGRSWRNLRQTGALLDKGAGGKEWGRDRGG